VMNRKAAVLAISFVALIVLVAGCGGGSSGSSGSSGTSAVEAPSKHVTLTFWNGFTGPDRPALEKLVKQFNSSQSKVTVKMTIEPWDVFFQKLLPSFAANKGPDMVAMDSIQLPQYIDKGLFEPVDDLYDNGAVPKDKLVSSAVEAGKWNGKYYGVPMNFTTLLLYWNKDMFKQAGLSSAPKTWAEWQADAQKLTKDSNGDGKPEQYGLALADHETIAMWPILIWGNGGDVVTPDQKVMLDDPKTVDAVDQWANLVRDKHISPIGLAGADADKLFQSKKAAMEVVGPWMTSGFKDAGIDFGLSMVPKGPAKQVTLGTSVMFAVSSKGDDDTKKAAKQFIAFWEKKPSQITWAEGSGFPPDRTDITADELTGNPYVAQFGKYADKSQFYLTGVKPVTQVDSDTFQPAIQKIENGKPAQSQLTAAANKIKSILSSSQ